MRSSSEAGVPLLTQAHRLSAIVPSATQQATFEQLDLTPVIRTGDRAARRWLGQLWRQVPQYIRDLRHRTADGAHRTQCRALVACLDVVVQLPRAFDRWLAKERTDRVNKRLRRRQKRQTNVGSVTEQVKDLRALVERLPGSCRAHTGSAATGTSSAASGVPATRFRSHHHVCDGGSRNSAPARCRSSSYHTGPHREIGLHDGACDARLVSLSCAELAGLLDPRSVVEVS